MGKAVPRGVKTRAEDLLEKFPEQFSNDFEKNKAFLDSLEFDLAKSTRNLIAGYIASIKNKEKAQ
ncbi:MAG: 30S ribosomal protein S17e [Candidatus Diapherotrites archaeon]|nr:30S ribosomal protein S17e [Candidatus Micrarchaeota archaeon]MBU1939377.1 30S ribosomal protein S17e [Candidatus Micrarchaeota archaeon]